MLIVTPVFETSLPTSFMPAGIVPSPKKRLPVPSTTGKIQSRNSVDEVVPQQRLDEAGAAVHLDLRAVLALERRDVLGNVALIRAELFHSTWSSVVEATCLRMLLSWSAIGPSSYGQWAAKIS